MPVDFLTPQQEELFGRFTNTPSAEQLARYFWLDDRDRQLVWRHRGLSNRVGFALQLGTVRFLGAFLTDPTDVPPSVVTYVSQQLKIPHVDLLLEPYRTSTHRWQHTTEIRLTYGYKDFFEQPHHFRLVRWLYHRAWLTTERPEGAVSARYKRLSDGCSGPGRRLGSRSTGAIGLPWGLELRHPNTCLKIS